MHLALGWGWSPANEREQRVSNGVIPHITVNPGKGLPWPVDGGQDGREGKSASQPSQPAQPALPPTQELPRSALPSIVCQASPGYVLLHSISGRVGK